jgi:hypothetical protein
MQQLTSMSKRPVAIKKVVMYSDGSAEMAIKNLANGNVVHKTRDARAPAAFSGLRWNEPKELVPNNTVATEDEVATFDGPFWKNMAANARAYARQETAEEEEVREILKHPPPMPHLNGLSNLDRIAYDHHYAAEMFNLAAEAALRILAYSHHRVPDMERIAEHARVMFAAGREHAILAHRYRQDYSFLGDYLDTLHEPQPDFFGRRDIPNELSFVNSIPWLDWIHTKQMNVQQKTSEIDLDVV